MTSYKFVQTPNGDLTVFLLERINEIMKQKK